MAIRHLECRASAAPMLAYEGITLWMYSDRWSKLMASRNRLWLGELKLWLLVSHCCNFCSAALR